MPEIPADQLQRIATEAAAMARAEGIEVPAGPASVVVEFNGGASEAAVAV